MQKHVRGEGLRETQQDREEKVAHLVLCKSPMPLLCVLLTHLIACYSEPRPNSPGFEEIERHGLEGEEEHVEEAHGHQHRSVRGRGNALSDRVCATARLGLHHRVVLRLGCRFWTIERRCSWEVIERDRKKVGSEERHGVRCRGGDKQEERGRRNKSAQLSTAFTSCQLATTSVQAFRSFASVSIYCTHPWPAPLPTLTSPLPYPQTPTPPRPSPSASRESSRHNDKQRPNRVRAVYRSHRS